VTLVRRDDGRVRFLVCKDLEDADEDIAEYGDGSVILCTDEYSIYDGIEDKEGEEELVRDIRVYAVSLLRVLNAEILPFDHARNARKLTEYVESYDDDAGEQFDFEPTLTELRALASEIDAFQEAAHDGRIDPAVANDAITSRSRVLTRLNLVQRGQFEQDPAVSREPVPRLAPARKFPILEGNDIEFLQVQLKRRQNAVVQELPEAHEVIPDIDA